MLRWWPRRWGEGGWTLVTKQEAFEWVRNWLLWYSQDWADPIREGDVTESTTLDELALDDLDVLELAVAIQDEYLFMIEEPLHVGTTVGEVAELISRKGA